MTRSVIERRLRALIERAGLPAPQANVQVAGYELDLTWPAHRLVVEGRPEPLVARLAAAM